MNYCINNPPAIWIKEKDPKLHSKIIQIKGNVKFLRVECNIKVIVKAQSMDMYVENDDPFFISKKDKRSYVHTKIASAKIMTDLEVIDYIEGNTKNIYTTKCEDKYILIPNSICCDNMEKSPLYKINENFVFNINFSTYITNPYILFNIRNIIDSHGNNIISKDEDVFISLKIEYSTI